MRVVITIAGLALLALLGACASNQELAANRCANLKGQGQAYDDCVAREQKAISDAQAQQMSRPTGGGY